MQVQNSLSAQLEHINMSQANILKVGKAYLEAVTSQKANVSVDVENTDGTITTIRIPSNIYLSNEFNRLSESFKNVVGLTSDGKSRLINVDGTFREILLSSFVSSFRPTVVDMSVSDDVKVTANSVVENLISPLTEIEIALNSTFAAISSAFITKIKTDDLTGISNGMSIGEVKRLLTTRKQTFEVTEFDKPVVYKKTRFFGEFNILQVNTAVDAGSVSLKLDTLTYSDSNNVFENTRLLSRNDLLTNSTGTALVKVLEVNEDTQTVTCVYVGGVGAFAANERASFKDSSDQSVAVRVPVRLNEKSVIFISVVDKNTNTSSAISEGICFNSDEFTVTSNGSVVSFNEYFSSRVADIGKYLESVVRENAIPAILGEKPAAPQPTTSDFNVVQINRHLTNTPNADKLAKLQKEKDSTKSKLSSVSSAITDLNAKISKGNYSSASKREADVNELNKLISDKVQLSSLLGTLVSDIDTSIADNAQSAVTPKYRVRGFWPIQTAIESEYTAPQQIVQYEIRYRYVPANGNTAQTDAMIYTDGENSVNAQFSSWQFIKTALREKVVDADGIASWKENVPSDTETASINQLDLPINFGESVEFNIRAISEAGYPNTPVMSDWSKLVRVNFPENLLGESDIAAIQRKNSNDALAVRLGEELSNQGVTKHIAKSFTEQDNYFPHSLRDIASGKTSAEQRQIDALTYIETLESKVAALTEKVDRRYSAASVQLIDASGNTHDVNNYMNVELSAGNYTDNVDMSNVDNYGTIVEKTFYLKIANKNQQTVEMLSISPGVLSQAVPNAKYANIPILNVGSNIVDSQKRGQIFYLRNVNVEGLDSLYAANTTILSTTVPESDVDSLAIDSTKNVVNYNGVSMQLVKLTSNAELSGYVSVTKQHPAYITYSQTNDSSLLDDTLDRVKYFSDLHRAAGIQNELSDNVILKYEKDDKFLVGRSTCGSSLYIAPMTISSFQVDGIDTSASKEIYSGDSDAILIPIKFQYRMTDALGNADGITSTTAASNFEYNKKLGFDILISGKMFSFDLTVSAKYRATAVSNNAIGRNVQASSTTSTNIQ